MRPSSRRALILAAIEVWALPSRADVPEAILDTRKYVQEEVYDLSPERRAEWEQGRYSLNGIWVGLGSYNSGELAAIERGIVNLPITSWFLFHGDVRNDRDRDTQVSRLVVDLFVRVLPWLWLGPSGSPAIPAGQKETYGIGASALIGDSERQRYLLARLVLDSLFYNQLNREHGTRRSTVFHPELEGRWASGPWSLYSRLDLTSLSETFFPESSLRTYQANARAEYAFHFRYQRRGLEGDARFDLLAFREDHDQGGQRTTWRRLLTTSRLEGLVRPLFRWPLALRFGLRLVSESVHDRGDDTYRLLRLEPGFRGGAIWEAGPSKLELGYASGVPHFSLVLNASDADFERYQDDLYFQWEYSPAKHFHIRAQLSWRVARLQFGGAHGVFLAEF